MAQYPKAQWHGPVPNQGGPMGTVRLIVLHVMQGTLTGTDGWFHDPVAQVSAHFGVGKDGTVLQWVDTSTVAWAEEQYNGEAISIEHEGDTGETLTTAQAKASLDLVAWLRTIYPTIPLQMTDDPNGTGLIGHGELGMAGGNHPDCPGQPILDQYKLLIVDPTAPGSPASKVNPTWRPAGPAPILQPGAKNPQQWVVYLRACLREAGFWPRLLPLHPGGFDILTKNALIRYKRSRHLAPNAVCGADTWTDLGLRP